MFKTALRGFYTCIKMTSGTVLTLMQVPFSCRKKMHLLFLKHVSYRSQVAVAAAGGFCTQACKSLNCKVLDYFMHLDQKNLFKSEMFLKSLKVTISNWIHLTSATANFLIKHYGTLVSWKYLCLGEFLKFLLKGKNMNSFRSALVRVRIYLRTKW